MEASPFGAMPSSVLAAQVPATVRSKGRVYQLQRAVTLIDGSAWNAYAVVRGTSPYRVAIRRDGDAFTASCECRYFDDRFAICKHIWAALLEAERRRHLLGDGTTGVSATFDPVGVSEGDPEFASPARTAPEWQRFLAEFSRDLAKTEASRRPPRFLNAEIIYVIDRAATLAGEGVAIEIHFRQRKKNGEWGNPKPAALSAADAEELLDQTDRDIIPMLLGATDTYGGTHSQLGRTSFRVVGPLVDRILPRILQSRRTRLRLRGSPREELTPLVWDEGPPWTFRLDLAEGPEDGMVSIDGALVRGAERLAIREPSMVLSCGYLFARGTVSRFDAHGAFAWVSQLRRAGPATVPLDAAGLLVDVLARSGVSPGELPEHLRFEIYTVPPQPCLSVRGPRELATTLQLVADVRFDYGGFPIELGPGTSVFDAERRRLIRRDIAFEQTALDRLGGLGFVRRWDFTSSRQALAIGAAQFPRAVRMLVAEGWRVEADGRAFRPAQSIQIDVRSGIDWFELHGAIDFGGGRTAALPRLLAALARGDATVTLDDGTVGIVPEEWLGRWAGIAELGETSGDHIRYRLSQAALLDAALSSQPAVRFDQRFARTRDEIAGFDGIAPLDPAPSFTGELRDYQRDALGWFAFLRRFGFGGCLADDMGLGKTVMVLAWLDRLRAGADTSAPSLVVVPRSVVFNWKEEAARFAPGLRVLDYTGASRGGERLDGHDVVLTTYGALRRDALRLKDVEFEYVILDEAQMIKNSRTAGAKAARLIRARHRLALSGTPVENHLGELWSLFEFLNPGLLGSSSAFARHGAAATRRDREALDLIGRGLRPFILRRTKIQVAPELPPRTEQTIHCELKGAQREMYDELRDHYRASLLGRIDRDGLNKSKIRILEALLRLRQAASHCALVDRRRMAVPSAKFDALLPMLVEVLDEGHKALVFSQFTSLLALLRARLDADGVVYEYLDGQTRDRDARVHRFQTDPGCGLFLISLKAGGLGLNLTAAEYVFLLDPWWNPAVEAQAIDRAHRIGQKSHVFAYRLIARDTVEEKVAELQQTKRELADAILGENAGLLRTLKREDLELLLS